MQIESLKVFCDLVETESFSKAARINNITQSAVSQQIRAIEDRFAVELVERGKNRFRLTREGQCFYESSKDILKSFDSLQSRLHELRNVVSGTIRIATIYSIGLHELPPYIKRFLKEYPTVNVHVEYRRSNQVYEDVVSNAVDLGLVAFPLATKQVDIISFRKDKMVLVCHPNHPFSKLNKIDVPQLEGQNFIGFEPDIPTRKAIDRIFRSHRVSVHQVMEFDNVETVKRAVEIDAGISILPAATVAQEVTKQTLHAIEFNDDSFYRPLGILYKKGRTLFPALKQFIKVLKDI